MSCGPGVLSRDVVCMKKLGPTALTVLGEENCMMGEKPATTQPCELTPCTSSWFMTEWTDVSAMKIDYMIFDNISNKINSNHTHSLKAYFI